MKTLVIRSGDKHTIRALAFSSPDAHARDSCPTLKFFEEQSTRNPDEFDRLKVLLTQTARSGPPQLETRFKHLSGSEGLYEFKTGGGLRLFAFWDEDSLIVCTHGFLKNSKKTPSDEIKRASRMKRDYFEAKKTGNLHHVTPTKSR